MAAAITVVFVGCTAAGRATSPLEQQRGVEHAEVIVENFDAFCGFARQLTAHFADRDIADTPAATEAAFRQTHALVKALDAEAVEPYDVSTLVGYFDAFETAGNAAGWDRHMMDISSLESLMELQDLSLGRVSRDCDAKLVNAWTYTQYLFDNGGAREYLATPPTTITGTTLVQVEF